MTGSWWLSRRVPHPPCPNQSKPPAPTTVPTPPRQLQAPFCLQPKRCAEDGQPPRAVPCKGHETLLSPGLEKKLDRSQKEVAQPAQEAAECREHSVEKRKIELEGGVKEENQRGVFTNSPFPT
ncbi:hypothetical protein P7K49_013403 [Saguinus oedipus]|uniref:Uncharacterized protein n=1 Tax=Saguinus oedipus TaxID=9490 RepID=A0ABQ9VFX6_SAGOE|nr:hypothetical protein P7K49_013403 [Saguinus oedipus]